MKQSTRIQIAIAVLIAICIPVVFANGEAEAGVDDEVVIEAWAMREDWIIDNAVFEVENPSINVDWQVVPWEVHLDRLIAAADTGTLPDMTGIDKKWHSLFYERGLLHTFTDKVAEWDRADQFPEGMWLHAMHGDDVVGVPYSAITRFLYYRVDWFEEAGIPHPPETWDDVIEAGQALQEAGYAPWGFTFRGARNSGTTTAFWPIFLSFGGEWPAGEPPIIDSQAGRDALQLYYDLVHTYGISSPETITFSSPEARGMFRSERTAMGWYLTHIVQSVVDAGLEYGEDFLVAEIPKVAPTAERINHASSGCWVSFNTSEHRDEVWKLMAYMTNDEPMLDFGLRYMDVARLTLLEREEYLEARPWIPVLKDTLEYAEPVPIWQGAEQAEPIYQEMIQRVLAGQATPDEAIAVAMDELDSILRQ